MKDFGEKLAIITGAGTGMGRELALQLAAEGSHLALCDVLTDTLAETKRLCDAKKTAEARVTTHECDVSLEEQVIAFRDAVAREHATDRAHLLFNNAGIGGGGSFVVDSREEWDKTFDVSWLGVYYCTRAFLPMLLESDAAHIVNTSSVNGFWACLGPTTPHTAYSAAKFAIKGFSEALLTDLRLNAPHVKVSVVMPGHIGTSIGFNTGRVLGKAEPIDWSAEAVAEGRLRMRRAGLEVDGLSDDEVRAEVQQRMIDFRDAAPVSAAQAATAILDGVREERWRILVGDDAVAFDRAVRQAPEEAYELSFLSRLQEEGHLQALTEPQE